MKSALPQKMLRVNFLFIFWHYKHSENFKYLKSLYAKIIIIQIKGLKAKNPLNLGYGTVLVFSEQPPAIFNRPYGTIRG